MKNYKLTLAAILLTTICISCKKGYLDQVPNDRLTLDAAFNNSTTAVQFLANTYSFLPDDANQQNAPGSNAGVWTGGSSEAEFDWGFVASQNVNNGAYDASSSFVAAYWNSYYQGIRSATVFMANVDKVPNLSTSLKTQYKAEARALRAIYYFYLMRIYGPVVLLGDQALAPDAPTSTYQLPRNSVDECVAYISSELETAAKDLPIKPANTNNYGRITSGFAEAIKSEALLYAASPLFNGNSDYSSLVNKGGKHLISQTADMSKWAKAAAAAKAFIDKYVPNTYNLFTENDDNGAFSPYLSCRDVVLVDWNPEIIYAQTNPNITTWQYDTTPYHQGFPDEVRGAGSLGATQEMVDAFFMANGKSITDPTSGYMSGGFQNFAAVNQDFPTYTYNQWIGREPRFYVNITYNNSEWLDKNPGLFITDLTFHGNSGRNAGQNDYCPTGYVVRKNNPPSDRTQGNRTYVMLRLAEIYLNYAEALNESDPNNPDIVKYLNLIRSRAGIPGYGQGVDMPAGQDGMRTAIRHERQVELAFENNRYFDVRRWKIADKTESGAFHGLDINSDAPDFYNVVTFEKRVFNKKSYLFPIPQADINSDTQLVQNTGW